MQTGTASERADDYLAACVRTALQGAAPPPWPHDLEHAQDEVAARIAFHGIALLLAEQLPPGLPDLVVRSLREEARLQGLWEMSHAGSVARLLERFHARGLAALVMKGTAIAYSCYRDPAVRRRGDTDIVLDRRSRVGARQCLAEAGFRPKDRLRGLQEAWIADAPGGFVHEVDIHWTMSASAVVSAALARSGFETRAIGLPRLSPHARGLGPIDNILMVCINRRSHHVFGYRVDNERIFDPDRLIWAVDLHLLCSRLQAADWHLLRDAAIRAGAAGTVLEGLLFARARLGTPIPDACLDALATEGRSGAVCRYLAAETSLERFKADLEACSGWRDKVDLVSRHLFPDRAVLEERFPGSSHMPSAVLHLGRLLLAVLGLFRPRRKR